MKIFGLHKHLKSILPSPLVQILLEGSTANRRELLTFDGRGRLPIHCAVLSGNRELLRTVVQLAPETINEVVIYWC